MEKRFYGEFISAEGVKRGFVDYACLKKAIGGAILNNSIMENTREIGYWDIFNGLEYDENDDGRNMEEIFQYFIISEYGAELLQRETKEIVFYNDAMEMYVWGVTHYGTSWDYVLTDIKIDY